MANWKNIGSRGNVEDRRGSRMAAVGGGGVGIVGIAAIIIFNLLSGGDATDILNQLQNVQVPMQQNINSAEFEGADSYEVFAATVLGSTNDLWSNAFAQANKTYTTPKLVLFRDATESNCGVATSNVGPHYCPTDQTIYLDETFFGELTKRFGARGGDVAQAYVIAHEAAHHAQNLLGITEKVYNNNSPETSVKLELQADCFAGLWAYSLRDRGVFEEGEITEAIDMAAAVGDDRIQKTTTGRVNPETWTHGSSEQRMAWFQRGYQTGSVDACNTF